MDNKVEMSDAAGQTHPEQDPGVKPSPVQEDDVEIDKQEGVDAQPYQLKHTG